MKKGFTLVELMAALVIISILLLIAVPVYNGVRTNVNKSIYESKVAEIKSKAISYASETNRTVMDVKTLISEGLITADNEAGEYNDPRDGRSMLCDIINVIYKNNQYEANITESEKCYELEELENLYGMVNIKVYKDANLTEELNPVEVTEWYTEPVIYVGYELKSDYQEYAGYIESISWVGEEPKDCSKENNNLASCQSYNPIETSEIKNVGIRVQINFNVEGTTFISSASKNILVDRQKPIVLDGSVRVDNDTSTSSERRVSFNITDNAGSGIKSYAIVSEKTCNGNEYSNNKKEANEGIQTEYIGNGTYYICVEDKVGNKTSDEDLNNSSYQITVSNVDSSKPVIESIGVKTTATGYNNLTPTLTIKANDDGGKENLTMCISNSGYMNGCTWEKYNETKSNYNVGGSLDGKTRTIYVAVQDSAGNVATSSATYTVYKECSQQTKVYTDSNYGTCSKTCGGGVQYRNYKMVDKFNNGKTCSTNRDQRTCNTQSCDPVESMDPNNYESSKTVACNATYFKRLVDNYTSKFQSALQSQNFRNALYDCGSTTASIIRRSDKAWEAMKNSGRTAKVSGRGKSASCTCYPGKDSSTAQRTCEKPACSWEHEQFTSNNLYNGRVYVFSMTQEYHNTKDDSGFGDWENTTSSKDEYGYASFLLGGPGEVGEAGGWGECTQSDNGIYNEDNDWGCDEDDTRIGTFESGIKVGLYRSLEYWYYSSSSNDRIYNYYYSGTVHVYFFKI